MKHFKNDGPGVRLAAFFVWRLPWILAGAGGAGGLVGALKLFG